MIEGRQLPLRALRAASRASSRASCPAFPQQGPRPAARCKAQIRMAPATGAAAVSVGPRVQTGILWIKCPWLTLVCNWEFPPLEESSSHVSPFVHVGTPTGVIGSFLDDPLGSILNVAESGLTGGGAGLLGPIFNPLNLTFRKAANAGVLYLAGKLYALSEVRGHGADMINGRR